MHDKYSIKELYRLDESNEGLLSSDLYALYGHFDLYRVTVEGDDRDTHLFFANALFQRLYHNSESMFMAHLQDAVINKPESVKKRESNAIEKKATDKRFKMLGWNSLNEQMGVLIDDIRISRNAQLSTVPGITNLPNVVPSKRPYSKDEIATIDSIFEEDAYEDEDDQDN